MSTAAWQVIGLGVLAAALFATGISILLQRRVTPERRERKRRFEVNERGRLAEGMVTDVGPDAIYYSYAISGVRYRASQDITHLSKLLPPDPNVLIGPVTLKYAVRNPANSILICESWSGLRVRSKEIVSQ
jgi:hypothetical protein